MQIPLFALLASALVVGGAIAWLYFTWDNTPAHHTFKDVVQSALRDIRDVFRLDALFAFCTRAGNVACGAVLTLATVIANTPELKTAILNAGPAGWLAYTFVCLAVTVQMRKAGAAPGSSSASDLGGEFVGVNVHNGPEAGAR